MSDLISQIRHAQMRAAEDLICADLARHGLTVGSEPNAEPRLEGQMQQLRGECNTLAGILRDAQAVIETIVPENDDEAERLFDLRVAMAHAVDPYKREGSLL